MCLQSETEELIAETVADIESEFDETVYKTDVVEAINVAAVTARRPTALAVGGSASTESSNPRRSNSFTPELVVSLI